MSASKIPEREAPRAAEAGRAENVFAALESGETSVSTRAISFCTFSGVACLSSRLAIWDCAAVSAVVSALASLLTDEPVRD